MTSSRVDRLLALAAILAVPAAARADLPFLQASTSASFEGTTTLESHDDRDAFEGNEPRRGAEGIGRLDLRLTSADWIFSAVGTGFGRITERDDPARRDVVDLEEISLGGPVVRDLRVIVGDNRPRFGRGLVLDLSGGGMCCSGETQTVTLRGARADLEAGATSLTALGGWIHLPPLDKATELPLIARSDTLGGARVQVRPSPRTSFALHYAAASLEAPEGTHAAGQQLAGIAAEIQPRGAGLGLYVEGAYSMRTIDARPQPGTGLYLAADYTAGPVTILLEGKDYNRFDFATLTSTFEAPEGAIPPVGGWPMAPAVRYHAPPTLDRMGELLPIDTNTLGGRGTVTLRITREVTLDVAYVKQFYFHARGDEPRAGPNGYFGRGTESQHLYGEIRGALPSGFELRAGGGTSNSVNVETGEDHARAQHGHLDTEIPVASGWSVAGSAELRARTYIGEESTLGSVGVSVRSPQGIRAGARYEYSDEFKDFDPDDEVVPRRSFVSVDTRVPLGRHELFAFLGSTAGGLRCLDGVCRMLPPFHGFRFGATLRF